MLGVEKYGMPELILVYGLNQSLILVWVLKSISFASQLSLFSRRTARSPSRRPGWTQQRPGRFHFPPSWRAPVFVISCYSLSSKFISGFMSTSSPTPSKGPHFMHPCCQAASAILGGLVPTPYWSDTSSPAWCHCFSGRFDKWLWLEPIYEYSGTN